MGSLNRASHVQKIYTEEGAVAKRITHEQQLRRSIFSCFLWEKEFYEDGESIASRIMETAAKCDEALVAQLAHEARHVHGLRHVPLLLLLSLVQRRSIMAKHAIANTIRRPDEMMELLAIYWKDSKDPRNNPPLSKQLQRGLALAFEKFNEYSLAKYNRDGPIKIRDVMFMTHPKPRNEEQARLFKRIAENKMVTPDTWEVELSAGKDKKVTFERLIKEGKLGYLALLRNLRNMVDAGCDLDLISDAIRARKGAELVFPFRYVAAARAAPRLERSLDEALQSSIKEMKPLAGTTMVLVDVSGSMDVRLSAKSDLTRMDAAATLASIINAERLRVVTFSSKLVEVPARRGMAGIDAVIRSQGHSSTRLAEAIEFANKERPDRLIVITDEQATGYGGVSRVPDPEMEKAYMINVASARNGIGYGKWVHLDGFSESIIKFIHAIEDYK